MARPATALGVFAAATGLAAVAASASTIRAAQDPVASAGQSAAERIATASLLGAIAILSLTLAVAAIFWMKRSMEARIADKDASAARAEESLEKTRARMEQLTAALTAIGTGLATANENLRRLAEASENKIPRGIDECRSEIKGLESVVKEAVRREVKELDVVVRDAVRRGISGQIPAQRGGDDERRR